MTGVQTCALPIYVLTSLVQVVNKVDAFVLIFCKKKLKKYFLVSMLINFMTSLGLENETLVKTKKCVLNS